MIFSGASPGTSPDLSVVLPCYNEARGLEAILRRFAAAGSGVNYELILVDNGSTDETPGVLESLLPAYPFARSVRIDKNQGYGHGIMTGLKSTVAPLVAWSHADLQTDPADVFMAYQIARGVTSPERLLIKGRRFGRKLQERLISVGMQALATVILRVKMSEINAQPKLFHRDLLEMLPDPPVDFNLDLYVLYLARRNGWRTVSFPVKFPPRQYGESNWAATWKSKRRTIARSIRYMLSLTRAR